VIDARMRWQASGWVAATRLICSFTPQETRGAALGSLAFSARVSSASLQHNSPFAERWQRQGVDVWMDPILRDRLQNASICSA